MRVREASVLDDFIDGQTLARILLQHACDEIFQFIADVVPVLSFELKLC